MANNFNDDATQFMTDLLKLLRRESNTTSLGESLSGEESVFSTLLRLVGVEKNIVLDVNGEEEGKEISTPAEPNLIDSFFKIQTGLTANQLEKINRLLKAYKKRLQRYSKGRLAMKLNRNKKLIENPINPINAGELIKNTPEQTRKALGEEQRNLQESGELTGIIDQDIALQKALETSVNATAVLPEAIGSFGSQLQKLIAATGKDAADNTSKLNSFKLDTQNEVNRLENTEKLLFDGIETFGGEDQKISLLGILNVLIFLTDRKQIKYNCSECKFFRTGKTDVCIFAGKGAISNTPLVSIADENNDQITGRQTTPTNSCKEVWGLDSNEYYSSSDSVKDFVKKTLKE